MEATVNYSTFLPYMLFDKGIATSLINPKQTRYFARMMMATIKTDQVDAKLIASYGKKMKSLTSTPGIGITIASALIIKTEGFSQFENAK